MEFLYSDFRLYHYPEGFDNTYPVIYNRPQNDTARFDAMITIEKTNFHYAFDPDTPSAARANSGETVVFRTRDCYEEQIDTDGKDFALLDMSRGNPATGPLYIDGAMPGDTLKIEILDIAPADHGCMCVRTGKGIYEVEGCHCRVFPIRDGAIGFDGLDIPIKPMIGVIGVAPAEPVDTHTPGEHGGNLDVRELGAGSVLYLPVAAPGALLSVGDLHALQGDGESAICGLEMSGEVTLRATVIKGGAGLPTPFLVTADAVYTLAADESLDVCSVAAARKMHRFLMDAAGLSDVRAAMLLSLRGQLRISQVVNPKKGCMMEFPLALLRKLKPGINEIF